MKVGYTYRIYPTVTQQIELAKVFGCTRYVYNWALRYRIDAYADGQKVNYNQSSAALTELKKTPEHVWLNEISCVPLQQGLRHLQAAYVSFFKGLTKFPTFKRKHDKQSAEFTERAFTYRNGVLSLTKIGPLNVRWSRPFTSKPTTVTVTKTPSGRYYVSLVLDETPQPFKKTGESIGIDLGIARLATLSNGEVIDNIRTTKKYEKRLAKAQRNLSRKTKGSGRYKRQRIKVARVQEKIADTRKDYLNKVTSELVKRFDLIAVEDLNTAGMVKNHKLAKHISDASFSTFVSMLEYKCVWRGRKLVKVDRWYPSSKTCSCCGYKVPKMPLSVRNWQCPGCETEHNRDLNAAKNILNSTAVGQTVTARGATVRPVVA